MYDDSNNTSWHNNPSWKKHSPGQNKAVKQNNSIRKNNNRKQSNFPWRYYLILLFLLIAVCGLLTRIIYLGVVKRDFLLEQGKARSVREVVIPAHRGIITDRNGEGLAISAPVFSIWINPKLFLATSSQVSMLTNLLGVSPLVLKKKIAMHHREFLYLKRGVAPNIANKVLELHIPGVFSQQEYKRYYPEAEVAAHIIGFTNIDDQGQEGLELAYNDWLSGIVGKMRVVKDRLGHVIENLGVITEPHEGHNLVLSIDRRVQYLAYRELKNTVDMYKADSGSVVVLGVKNGEILAVANMPSYNPNNRQGTPLSNYRNRAVTDLFEPGSTLKAISIASALASGKYKPSTLINTNPGRLVIDGNPIYDDKHINYGTLTVEGVLKKSSNIGVTKMTLSLPPERLLNLLRDVGFGQTTQSGFPGEAAGFVPSNLKSRPFELATLSWGYGISVTAIQLAQAYAVIASQGLLRPITFLKMNREVPGKQVMNAKVAKQMLTMLQAVLDIGGTGTRAHIPGYTVAGKTGTAYIASSNGYYQDRYFSMFVGIAPVSDPQLVVVVIIKNPHGQYHGGLVAAPAFAHIMEGALRILRIPEDAD